MALAWAALLRIIPARAGFTGRDNLVQRPAQDHPRSRGVYAAEAALADEAEGSSPLARGLHHPSRAAAMRARIIPARAGFTRPSMRIRPRSWDHPRSRGVYWHPGRGRPRPGGSSPLARGLPQNHGQRRRQLRIIPARAGFTRRWPRPRRRPPDHPRSRGVYPPRAGSGTSAWGSSPLARGLRRGERFVRERPRIIPARAGFTGRCRSGPRRPGDHPRSRGVYQPGRASGRSGRGSSPLARGLRRRRRAGAHRDRIIPARAGFTPRPTRTPGRSSDHPRSRGVYSTGSPRPGAACGSSPLARGLRSL